MCCCSVNNMIDVFAFRCHIKHIENDTFYNVKNLLLILTGNPITYFGPGFLNSLHILRLVLVDVGFSS